MEPEKPSHAPASRLTPAGPQHSNSPYSGGARGQGPYTQPPRVAKPKRRWLPILALAAVLGAGGVGAHYYTSGHSNITPTPLAATNAQQTLTLSGADLDEATTTAAIAAIHAGQNDNPLIAKLTEQQKQEIVSGQRKFYKLPIAPAHAPKYAPSMPGSQPEAEAASPTAHAAAAPAKHLAHPIRHAPAHQQAPAPQAPVEQPTPALAPTQDAGPQDRIQVVIDGVIYGTYNITDSPLSVDFPFKNGDVMLVTCLELSPGKSSVTVGIGTVLNPAQGTLSVGQSFTWTVHPITTPSPAADYEWFHNQAADGNPVAEYGLGHMYQYGIGLTQNTNQAIHWYQQAANQNYRDAQQRLAELGQ